MQKLKVSVITVCFNRAHTIAKTLASVHNQSYDNIEHIVIDGNSTDNTLEVIYKTPNRIAELVSEPDLGIYDAMNKGLSRATGDIVGFLNSDDVYEDENVISEVASQFSDQSVQACYGDIVFVSSRDHSKIVRFWEAGQYNPCRIATGWLPPHPTFYVRRRLYEEIGYFDTRYKLQADFDMAIRLLKSGDIKLSYIARTLVRMRMGGASNASIWNVIKGNYESFLSARRHGLKVGISFPIRKIFSRIPQFFARPKKL